MIHTSSIAAIGLDPAGQPAGEDTAFNLWAHAFDYVRSKYLAHQVALAFAPVLDVVLVCPGIPLGPGDIGPTPTGKTLVDTLNGKIRVSFEGVNQMNMIARNIHLILLINFILFTGVVSIAQSYTPIPVTGFNHDIIAQSAGGTNRAAATTTTGVDETGYVFYAKDFRGNTNANTAPPYGLPQNGLIINESLPGANFQLSSYQGNNAIVLKSQNEVGTLQLVNQERFSKVVLLGTSGDGVSNVTIKLNIADNTTYSVASVDISDWFGASNFAIRGTGRVLRSNDDLDGTAQNPRLYNIELDIPQVHQHKLLTSIAITKNAGTPIASILAVSGAKTIPAAPASV